MARDNDVPLRHHSTFILAATALISASETYNEALALEARVVFCASQQKSACGARVAVGATTSVAKHRRPYTRSPRAAAADTDDNAASAADVAVANDDTAIDALLRAAPGATLQRATKRATPRRARRSSPRLRWRHAMPHVMPRESAPPHARPTARIHAATRMYAPPRARTASHARLPTRRGAKRDRCARLNGYTITCAAPSFRGWRAATELYNQRRRTRLSKPFPMPLRHHDHVLLCIKRKSIALRVPPQG